MSVSFKYDENNKYHRALRWAVIVVASLITFVIFWWFLAAILDMTAIPTPMQTFDAFISLLNDGDPLTGVPLSNYLQKSFTTFLEGFAIAFMIAVPLGLFLGFVKPLKEFLTPIIEVLRPIAPIAWAPIFILSFGYKIGPPLVVFIGIFFPLLTNAIFGVEKIDKTLIDASRTLGANNIQIFTKVILPSAVPYIMNGVKVGLGIGWMCIVAAELYNTTLSGIGYFVKFMIDNASYDYAFAGIIIIAILGLLTTGVAEYISKVVSRRMGVDV